ncbi:unnamed protein product [Eruca vesicaria subsp. sativa]|uniref:Insecticidal crystal toxin domain-containing protein n=1 Tax=Eruca vesicaria subsp. sativa TaxID=29727 RepID=A0ABC8LG36_ERUVS|nr:unnamed protein product [Eruca vesicaria subsp. sativa]
MYVTRRLSEYQRNPLELEQQPPEGPNSGVFVIQDEESRPVSCFGLCYGQDLKSLPFPQNVKLTVSYSDGDDFDHDPVLFIPVPNQPLSSNCYYVIRRRGKHSGEASASAKEEDRVPYCFCFNYVPEAKPRQADPYDIYQQFQIHQRKSYYYSATSVAPDGVPPQFLKRKDWRVGYSTSENFGLTDDAKGINTMRRSKLPGDFNTSIVVGKWYVPFIFVKERDTKAQLKRSTYYRMTLRQSWEEVYSCGNVDNREVVVDVEVESELVKLEGQVIEQETRVVDGNGVVWFEISGKKVGLRSMVVERMKWEEERFGWSKETGDMKSSIKRSERFEGNAMLWHSYKCYVLVESFELKRMDGSLVLTFEFRHVDKLKSKWD